MNLLVANNLVRYEAGVPVVNDVSLHVKHGVRLGIIGETGSGKTTLLKMLAGLAQPASGNISLNGRKVNGPDEELIPGHKFIAYLSQHFELRNNYRVHEILEMANKVEPFQSNEIYNACRINHLMQRWSDELSGGEKQRIALARLLTMQPKFLLMDEPFSNLDAGHKEILMAVLDDIEKNYQITMVMVSHDAADLLSWAKYMIIMQSGQVIQEGAPEDIYHYPENEYCAGLLGEYNLVKYDQAVFSKMRPYFTPGLPIIIRPEQFKICSEENYDLLATIEDVIFYGSYYKVLVRIENYTLKIQACENLQNRSGQIYLKYHPV